MANRAVGVPPLTAPEPVAGPQLTSKQEERAVVAIPDKSSRWADNTFHAAVLACGLSILVLVGIIIYRLGTKGGLAWHAFGWNRRALDALLVARNLERVADHASNIAEDIIFWVRGADVRHNVGPDLGPRAVGEAQ
jgi:hypothetical protein